MTEIVYITSGKTGIHSFTHNELSVLEKRYSINLCLTQLNNGPYMPKKEWNTIIFSNIMMIFAVIYTIFSNPKMFFKSFKEALGNKVVPYFLIATYFLYKLKKISFTCIHCQMGDHKLFIAYYLKKYTRKPLTVTIHAHELYMRDLYDNQKKYIDLYSFCDKIITISDFNKNILTHDYNIEPKKVSVMRLFPEMNRINKLEGKIKMLIVGYWVEKKGYKVLLEALKRIQRNDLILMIVGGLNNNPNYIDVERLVKKMGLQDKVFILGKLGGEFIDIIFSTCDIFCLPSYTIYYDDGKPITREGIPVALMEAMAWGKPVISTKHAGIPELVEEVLIEENNIDELVEAITYLLKNRDKWVVMGERNRNIIMEKYSSSNVGILSNIFDELSSC